MSRRRKDPLRILADDERTSQEQVGRATSAPAGVVARARALVAVADGASYTEAARRVGRRGGGARGAVQPGGTRGGRAAPWRRSEDHVWGSAERERTASWSLTTLQRALRSAEDGLPEISTYTIWCVLREADLSWQRDRSWCHTGLATRRRKAGEVAVHDPDATVKRG